MRIPKDQNDRLLLGTMVGLVGLALTSGIIVVTSLL